MQAIQQIRVAVHYNDPLVAAGLAAVLRSHADFDVEDADASPVRQRPDALGPRNVLVCDYDAGLAMAAARADLLALRCGERAPAVLVVTQRETEWEIRRALESGVRGYIALGCAIAELVDAVRALSLGVRHLGSRPARLLADSIVREALTPREEDVLRLVVEGHGNKAIANALDIATGTVKTHLKSIFGKLEATSRTEAVTLAERRGLLHVLPRPVDPDASDRRFPPATADAGLRPTRRALANRVGASAPWSAMQA